MSRSNDKHLESLLADAVFEYLDKGMLDELEADMAYVIDKRIKQYQQRVEILKSARRRFTLPKLRLLVNQDG